MRYVTAIDQSTTSTLGAAYAAGLKAGFWQSQHEVLKYWKKVVQRSVHWAS